jgi:hypothetical protein
LGDCSCNVGIIDIRKITKGFEDNGWYHHKKWEFAIFPEITRIYSDEINFWYQQSCIFNGIARISTTFFL